MAERLEHPPGTPAPVTGYYRELNIFGTPTGRIEHVPKGEHLPLGPRGYSWREADLAPAPRLPGA